jgi:enoyl-CoA hydratase
MAYEKIKFHQDVISRITLNDPKRRNALSHQLCKEVLDALKVVENDPRCRVVILDAEGPVFSAGHDIAEEIPIGSPEPTQENWREFLLWLRHGWYLKLWEYPKPIICKVDGVAIAGGIELSCFADACICSEESFFTYFPIAQMTVAMSPSQIVIWRIGMWKMKEILMGKGFTGKEAEACGLVNKCVPRAELENYVMEHARYAAKALPDTLRLGKFVCRFIYDRLGVHDAIVFGTEMDIMAHCHSADKAFTDIMRTEGVKGMVRLAQQKMAE